MGLKIGDTATFSKTLTESDVYQFAGICGDFNPLHVDEEKAQKSRFGRRICHGMLVASLISTVIRTNLPGNGIVILSTIVRNQNKEQVIVGKAKVLYRRQPDV